MTDRKAVELPSMILAAPCEPVQSIARRLGVTDDTFWAELDSGRIVAAYLRLPELDTRQANQYTKRTVRV